MLRKHKEKDDAAQVTAVAWWENMWHEGRARGIELWILIFQTAPLFEFIAGLLVPGVQEPFAKSLLSLST